MSLKKIKVLECIRQGQIGGGESHLLSLVENLNREVYEPEVLSFTDGPMIERLHEMNIKTHIIHTQKPFDILKWRSIKGLLKERNIDMVHAHGSRASSNIFWPAKSLQIPLIYTIHGWSFHQDQSILVRKLRVMGEQYLTGKSDINISVSASNRDSGKKLMKSFQSVVVNNGIDQQKFNPEGNFKNIRKELGIPENKIIILFIARFTSHKQPLSLLYAFKEAVKLNPSLHLLMVGDGDQKAMAVDYIDQFNLSGSVTLQPFRQDVPSVLHAAEIFVLPSLWEGLPIGLLEAMAMGKSIIATNVDGTCEVVKNNFNGLLIDTENLVPNLTDAILEMASDKEMRTKFGKMAIETVSEKFNAVSMTRAIENLYSQALAKSRSKKKFPHGI